MTHVDTTLGSDGVRSSREKLGNTSSLESTLGCGSEIVVDIINTRLISKSIEVWRCVTYQDRKQLEDRLLQLRRRWRRT